MADPDGNKGVCMNGPDIDWSRLDDALEKLSVPDRPAPDWFTAAEYAQQINMATRTARDRLKRLVDAGVVERTGQTTIFYRIKKV